MRGVQCMKEESQNLRFKYFDIFIYFIFFSDINRNFGRNIDLIIRGMPLPTIFSKVSLDSI